MDFRPIIDQAKRILLHFHPRPDPDSVGSALAMSYALKGLGKQVTVISGDSPKPDFLPFLPGGEAVLDQDFATLDWSAFDLFIVLDSGGWSRVSELPDFKLPANLVTLVIDHHQSTTPFAQYNLLKPDASSTSEILFDLFHEWQIKLTPEIAICLLVGIWGDTGSFKYPNTTSHTLTAAAELVKAAPEFWRTIDALENNQSYEQQLARGLGLAQAERLFDGALILTTLSRADLAARGLEQMAGAGNSLAPILRSIAGCQIAISLIEESPGVIKMSARSRDGQKYDVSKLAVALGGGGHRAAAGATLAGTSVAPARERVLALVAELYGL